MAQDTKEITDGALRVSLYKDDVPLIGEGSPKIRKVSHLLRMLATIYDRFGDTAITLDGKCSWGGSALHIQDRLTADLEAAENKLQIAEKHLALIQSGRAEFDYKGYKVATFKELWCASSVNTGKYVGGVQRFYPLSEILKLVDIASEAITAINEVGK
jgi:hypothetical protein